MRQENLKQLDEFLDVIDSEIRTTRRASEKFFNSPPLDLAVEGERQVKATLDKTFEGFAKNKEAVKTPEEQSVEAVKANYWEKAKWVSPLYGAKEVDSIDEYFHVASDRSEAIIRKEVRERYGEGSTPSLFLDAVEAYTQDLDLDSMSAARIATTNLKHTLPAMRKHAEMLTSNGHEPVAASNAAFRLFSEDIVPNHIEDIKQRDSSIHGTMNKRSFYPTFKESERAETPLRMTRQDAEGIMSVYRLERRPYSDEELVYGEEIIQDPNIQSTLLLFQMAIVDYSRHYLQSNPSRMEHSLLPFSEFFIQKEGLDLVPNPKLIKVLGNNLVPAIASRLLDDGNTVEELTPSQIAESAREAQRRRVFQAQIGKFNNYDEATDTVDLDTIFNRTCPAMQILTDSMSTWLPHIYERVKSGDK